MRGRIRVPGDKSVSHRALVFGALATGRSRMRGLLNAADVRSTANALRALGVHVPELADEVTIAGVGLRGLRSAESALDCGNSGTTTRLMAGVVASYDFVTKFVGDQSLSRRPMRRVAQPLSAMGARVALARGDVLPMEIRGGPLRPIDWENQSSSAQVKSAILLAGLTGGVSVRISAPRPSRDHTERFLKALGATVTEGNGSRAVTLDPPVSLSPFDVAVPADPSSAAYLAALAALADEGEIVLEDVLDSPYRDGFFRALGRMGARVNRAQLGQNSAGDALATYTVGAPASELQGIDIDAGDVAAMIDELPLLACVATRAAVGDVTVVTGASELRVKESDRISVTTANLRAVGATVEELQDGLRIVGAGRRPLRGPIATHGDHRIAMAFGVLGALAGNEIAIDDRRCVDVSYPGFWEDLERATGAVADSPSGSAKGEPT